MSKEIDELEGADYKRLSFTTDGNTRKVLMAASAETMTVIISNKITNKTVGVNLVGDDLEAFKLCVAVMSQWQEEQA